MNLPIQYIDKLEEGAFITQKNDWTNDTKKWQYLRYQSINFFFIL